MPAVTHESGFDSHLLVHFVFQHSIGAARLYTVSHRYTLAGGAPTISTIKKFADQLHDGFRTEFMGVLTAGEYFQETRVTYYGGSSQLDAIGSGALGPGNGGRSVPCLPEEDAVVIRKKTGLAGRTHRGRIFMPLVPAEFQIDGRLTDDGMSAYQDLAYKFKQVWTFSGDIAAVTGTPKHAAWSAGTLDTIVETGVVADVLNRRDRRDPKALFYVASAP